MIAAVPRVRRDGVAECPRSSTSGSTPAACPSPSGGTRHQGEESFRTQYPADYICEAIDQTRGWFYTLMTVGTLVFDQSAYRNVLCLGHILDKDGRKMSKHLGNVLEPMPLMERARGRRRAMVHVGQRVTVVGATGQPRVDPGGRAQDAADLLEHRVLPGALRTAGRLDAGARTDPSTDRRDR